MSELVLLNPTIEMEDAIMDYRQEFLKESNKIPGSGGLHHYEVYTEYLIDVECKKTINNDKHVPSTQYFAFIGERIVGSIQIRHKLNNHLFNYGGNIGYSVGPSERRKGYASQMLEIAIDKCRILGLNKVLITCDKDNIASAKTIQKNDGILENEFSDSTGNIIQRYWVKINPCIRHITSDDFAVALQVIHASFATVAVEFNLTRENCPRHTSFIPIDNLKNQFKWGWIIFGLFDNDNMVGYASLSKESQDTFELHNLAVLPEYRHKGYGKMLLEYAKNVVGSDALVASCKIKISIIEENTTLKNWYVANGFVNIGTKKFDHLPFTVGFMEWRI